LLFDNRYGKVNCKSANSWAHSAITNPQILRCASLQIANPQIFS
jgi:hypothetical protein